MRISGAATMHAPADRVWAALTDPAVLVATIPGCEQFKPAGPDSYRFTVAAAIASIQASYTGEVSLSQQQEPSSFVLTASGAGAPGTVTTSVQIRLADIADGTTALSYDADAVIGGLIAGVGQRMLSSVAKRLAGAFFSSVDEVLAGTVRSVVVPSDTGLAATAADSQAALPAEPGPVPELTVPLSTEADSAVPATTGPATTGPATVGPQADASPARARRGGSAMFSPNGEFARDACWRGGHAGRGGGQRADEAAPADGAGVPLMRPITVAAVQIAPLALIRRLPDAPLGAAASPFPHGWMNAC